MLLVLLLNSKGNTFLYVSMCICSHFIGESPFTRVFEEAAVEATLAAHPSVPSNVVSVASSAVSAGISLVG